MNWTSNTMCFNLNGVFDLSDNHRDSSDFNEDIYLQCIYCLEYSHPSKCSHDDKNEVICNDCKNGVND